MQDFIVDLSDFRIIDILGEGSFGSNILLQENETQKLFTAQISRCKCKSKQDQQSFFREIKPILKISNQSILSPSKMNRKNFRNKHYPTIISEYMPKGSLRKLIEENINLSLPKKYTILYDIAEGMKYLHLQKIIHGNLTPDNILFDQDLNAHITDYGLYKISEIFDSSYSVHYYPGSPPYMAPEVFKDLQYSYKSDVYSFSILAYEFLTGSFPFQKVKTIYRLQKAILKGKRPNLSSIQNEAIQLLLTKCWSDEPDERPNFTEICETLQNEKVKQSIQFNSDEKSIESSQSPSKSKLPPLKPNSNPKIVKQNQDDRQKSDSLNYRKNDQQKSDVSDDNDQQKSDVSDNNDHQKSDISNDKKDDQQKSDTSNDEKSDTKKIDDRPKSYFSPEARKKALEIKKEADKGNPIAMYNYGRLLEIGNGVTLNKPEAVRYYKMSSDKGNTESMIRYADILSTGDGIQMNKKEAAYYYRKASDLGNLEAMVKYGLILKDERGKQKEAARMFKKAADKGSSDGMYYYGLMLGEGLGVQANQQEAIRYYKMSADKGNSKGLNIYGVLLYNGEYVEQNKEEATRLFKIASEKGNVDATYNYANSLFDGEGVEQNKKQAAEYYKIAADKGDIVEIKRYAQILYNGIGVPPNKKEAALYFKMAADKGDLESIYKYANMLMIGDGIESNNKEAAYYYKIAADQGIEEAMLQYGQILMDEEGVKENKKEALLYFKKAIDLGNKVALTNYLYLVDSDDEENKEYLAQLYKMDADNGSEFYMMKYADLCYNGIGVNANKKEAIRYYKMAAEQNNPLANCKYHYMLYKGEGIKANKKEALQFFKDEIENLNVDAMRYYALILYKGDGKNSNDINLVEAARYFKMAIDNGDSHSLYYYGLMLYDGDGVEMDREKAAVYFYLAKEDDQNKEAEKIYENMIDNGECSEVEFYCIDELSEYFSAQCQQ